MTTALEFREARVQDLWESVHPGKPVPPDVARLRSWECTHGTRTVGHCTGDSTTGEIVGLSVVAAYQGQGIGKRLLSLVVDSLRGAGAQKIWLASPSDPNLRAYGFYRATGWVPTGERPSDNEEILELRADG